MNDQIEQLAPFRWKVRLHQISGFRIVTGRTGFSSTPIGLGKHGR